MFSKRGEISTLVVLGVLSIIGVATLISSTSPNRRNILNTRAAGGSFSQCNASGSNQPCGSCNITDISVDSAGKATMTYGCQLLCDQIDINSCPVGTYEVKDSSWFWCSGADGSSCTEGDSDLLKNIHSTDSTGTFTVSSSNTNETKSGLKQSATFEGWTGCGRVQADIQINAPGISVAGFTKSFGSSCGDSGTTENTPVPNNSDPTNTPNSQNTPTKTKLPNGTACKDASSCQNGCCAGGYCNNASACTVATPTSISSGCSPNQKKCPGSNVCQPKDSMCQATPTPVSVGCSPNQRKCPGSNVCQPIDSKCQATPTPVSNLVAGSFSISPNSGTAGTAVKFSGSGWPKTTTTASIYLKRVDNGKVIEISVANITINNGNLSGTFTYPSDSIWKTPGNIHIYMVTTSGLTSSSSPFTVNKSGSATTELTPGINKTPTPVPTQKPTRFRTQEDKVLKACPTDLTGIISSLDCYYENGRDGLNNILNRINE
jgi:hypothetical protein